LQVRGEGVELGLLLLELGLPGGQQALALGPGLGLVRVGLDGLALLLAGLLGAGIGVELAATLQLVGRVGLGLLAGLGQAGVALADAGLEQALLLGPGGVGACGL